MIFFLIILMCVLAALQPGDRKIVAGTFAVMHLMHSVFFGYVPGIGNYIAALAVDMGILFTFCRVAKVDRFTDLMILICTLSICGNLYGLTAWALYLPPDIYKCIFTALYLVAIFVFLWGLESNGIRTYLRRCRPSVLFSTGCAVTARVPEEAGL